MSGIAWRLLPPTPIYTKYPDVKISWSLPQALEDLVYVGINPNYI
jgi:hypothetical protein